MGERSSKPKKTEVFKYVGPHHGCSISYFPYCMPPSYSDLFHSHPPGQRHIVCACGKHMTAPNRAVINCECGKIYQPSPHFPPYQSISHY